MISPSTSYFPSTISVPKDIYKKVSITRDKAPFFSRFFMILRELPSFLSTAYSLRYKDVKPKAKMLPRLIGTISRYTQLINEILHVRISKELFDRNAQRLDADFDELNYELNKTKRPICAYFVSSEDSNGAILGDRLYYYHHYKINKFKEHFDITAKVVRSTKEVFEHLNKLKAAYPDRPIKVVDIVAHGSSDSIWVNYYSSDGMVNDFKKQNVGDNDFAACGPDAAIILDACSTGRGVNSIAEVIAEKNPGKRVFAPGVSLFFSKPIFGKNDEGSFVKHVTHGFAIINAYSSLIFTRCANF